MEQILSDQKESHLHCETLEGADVATEEVVYTDEDERRVRRRLDWWIIPVLIVTYGLQ